MTLTINQKSVRFVISADAGPVTFLNLENAISAISIHCYHFPAWNIKLECLGY